MDYLLNMFDIKLENPRRIKLNCINKESNLFHTESSQFCRLYVFESRDIDMMIMKFWICSRMYEIE